MRSPSHAFVEMLAGKTPEAMYDALHAGRYLSARAHASPPEVLEAIKTTILTHRQRPLARPRQVELVSQELAASVFLSDDGWRLYKGETDTP
jgi:hypothetical protein